MAEESGQLHPESAEVLESFALHVLLDGHPKPRDAAVLGSLLQAARDGTAPSAKGQSNANAETLACVHEAMRSLESAGLAVRVGPGAWSASPAARRARELLSRV